uniref:PDZ domain-containing protein n=1 Tax=Chelonoidis abingdonii TaxID=106734 RepID=A0A8C0GL90_CHEAB
MESRCSESMEVTLKTEVESGASGFSVTGGGNEGIFVKQVLKGSPASKIFSLREGDQLLSATIFFDNIKYEDALKILQYSEPYKVQFSLKRKLAGKEELEKIHSTAQHKKEKIKDVSVETPEILTVQYSASSAYETKAGEIQDNVKIDLKDMENGLPIYTKKYSEVEINITKQKDQRATSKLTTATSQIPPITTQISKPTSEIQTPGLKDIQSKQMPQALPRTRKKKQKSSSEQKSIKITLQHPEEGITKKEMRDHLEHTSVKIKAPKVDITLPSEDVSLPKAEVEIKGPEATPKAVQVEGEIKATDKDAKGKESKFKMPKFSMPSFGWSTTKEIGGGVADVEASLKEPQVTMPSARAEGQITVSGPAIQAPNGEKGKIKMPDVKLPSVKLPEVKAPQVQVLEGLFLLWRTLICRYVSNDSVIFWLKIIVRHFKLPKFKLPSFSWSLKKEASIKADSEALLEEPKITISSGKTDTKLAEIVTKDQGPSIDLDIEISTGKEQKSQIKKPQFIMPKISFSKIKAPKSQVNLPKVEADVTAPKPERDGEDLVQIPDIESSHTKSIDEGAQINIKMPKVQIPTLDFSKPEIKVPRSDMDISLPKADATFPTYDVSLQQADLKLRSAGDDLSLSPEVKAESLEGKMKMPKFQKLKFGISLPKGKRPESEISLPKMESGVPQLTKTTDIADIAVEAPILEIKSDVSHAEIEVSAGKMKMPQVSITDSKAPKMDASLPSVSVSTTEVAIQSPKVEDMKVQVEHEMKSGEIQTEEHQGWFKMPKFRMPTFGRSSSKEKRGDIDSEGSLEKPQVSAPSAETQTEIEAPKYATSLPYVDTESTAGKDVLEAEVSLPPEKVVIKVSIPGTETYADVVKRGAEGQQLKTYTPKVMIPKVELSTSETRVDISLPKSPEIGAKAPSVEIALDGTQKKLDVLPKGMIKSTEKDVQGRESKSKMPKFSVPSFGWPATKGTGDAADVKTNLEETKIGAPEIKMDTEISVVDHEIQFPAESVEKDISAEVRVKVEGGDEARKMKTPKFKMPKFGALHSKAKGSEVDVFLPKLEADVSLPKTELSIVEIQLKKADGSIDLQSPSSDLMEPSTGISKDKPDKQSESVEVNIKIPKLKIPAFTYNAPTVETDVSTSKVATDVKGAGTDIETPKLEVSTRIPKERPEFVGSNIQTPSIKIPTLAEYDIKTPQGDGTDSAGILLNSRCFHVGR